MIRGDKGSLEHSSPRVLARIALAIESLIEQLNIPIMFHYKDISKHLENRKKLICSYNCISALPTTSGGINILPAGNRRLSAIGCKNRGICNILRHIIFLWLQQFLYVLQKDTYLYTFSAARGAFNTVKEPFK